MVRCGFLFDIVVVRIDVPNHPIEDPATISVDACFNNVTLKITPSRINVVEFKRKRSFDFDAKPEDLRRDLSVCPLRIKVFDGSVIIGQATIPWADCFLERITSNMGEITHIDECDLINEKDGEERVGTMEFICRLQCKCEEPSDELCGPPMTKDLRKSINKIIDPNDILFVVAEPNKEDVCNIEPNDDGEEPCCASNKPTTALDLSPYRILNGRLVQNADVVNTCQNLNCCDLMKQSNQYQKLIDALNPCQKKGKSNRKCQAMEHCDECPHHNKFSSHSDTSSECSLDGQMPCSCFANNHDQGNNFGGRRPQRINVCPPAMPLPDNKIHTFKTPRNCPVCKEDVRWLPKLAACPKCGYKPVPIIVEKPHNENLTAEQVLQEYLDNNSSGSDSIPPKKSCEKKSICRCSCTKGKVCANCRVRKMCGEILEPPVEEEECGKCTEDTEEQFRLCTTSSQDCRPHLARVFSELRDLFDATTPKTETEIHNEKCEAELNPPVVNKKRLQPGVTQLSQMQKDPIFDMCGCPDPPKKRKKYRKRRGEGRCYGGMSTPRSICRPQTCCEQTIPSRDERLQKFHDTCIDRRKNVPSNMGWLWNANPELGPRWRPGAIRKPIKEIMRYFLRDFPADTIPISRYSYRRTPGKGDDRPDNDEDLVQKPTLHICKKNGEIFVTLRPLKSPEALRHCADPYMNMKPIQFKIVKNPLASEISKMKRCLKDMGFNKCTCHKPVVECFCRSFLDKKRLEYQMKKECRKRGLQDCCQSFILSDTSESEIEYDFGVTPPAGLVRPDRGRKPDKVNVGTQYEQCDWNLPPSFPKPPNTFMKWINCATGHKYAYRRASDLLTIGQKEAIECKKRKLEEAKSKKANKKGGKGSKAGSSQPESEMKAKDYMQICPEGGKVNMRNYLDPKKTGPLTGNKLAAITKSA